MLTRALALLMPRIGRRFPGPFRRIFRRVPPPMQVRLADMITAYWTSQAICVAAELCLPDLIESSKARRAQAAELATRLKLPEEPLHRLLRALAGARITREHRDGSFSLTEFGQLLVSDRAGSMRAIAAIAGGEWFRAWGELRYSVATGACAFEKVYGEPFFNYSQSHPQLGTLFDEGMRGISSMTDVPIAIGYDFSKLGTLTDIGGGAGTQMATILRLHPRVQGVVFDLPSVVEHAQHNLPADARGVLRRLSFAAGDFRTDPPPRSNGYLMKSVLHDWCDHDAVQILKTCSSHMQPEDRLLIAEHVIHPGSGPQFGKILDLMMLVNLGGKERTRAQYQSLLAQAGLRLASEYPTIAEMTILEAVPDPERRT